MSESGNKIQAVLIEKGHSQVWLAKKLDKHKNTVYGYCSGKIDPPKKVIFQIAQILNVHLKDLL